MNKKNVIVVGAGPSGLLCALGLARAGIEVCVVERDSTISNSPRAMVYHWAVLEGLEQLGVLEDVLEAGFTSTQLQFFIFGTGERITLDAGECLKEVTPHPYNVHLGQNKLAEIALRHLKTMPNFKIHWSTNVSAITQQDDGVTLHCQQEGEALDLDAGWVVGADGANSSIRKALGLGFEGVTWPERFVATNLRLDFSQLGHANATMMLDPEHGAIIARIDNEGLWRCTFSESLELPEESIAERIPAFLAKILPAGTEYELVQFSPYRMHQRTAESMRVGRVILAGDAAHVTNPTGGLGLTSGLFDIYVLHEALTAVIEGRANQDVLDQYSNERRAAFLEQASPAATEFKQLVFNCSDKTTLEQTLVGLRHLAAHPEQQFAMFGKSRKLQTASIVK
ncbi:FAD-dependent oxidoreductase [Pseudomonas silesiensis]|uniref:FAD-dependent oxidoreductase n=1 Tax=Pseudomonas silesiensis TaxID=1853130 RepID=UPI0034D5C4A7